MSRTDAAPLGRPYWLLWSAASASYLGSGITFGALPLLAASLTRDARVISLTEAVGGAGWLLLGLVSGVLVDRWRRTSTMWIVDAVRAVVAGVFAAFVLADLQTIPLLLLVGFGLGLLAPFFDNASSAVVPDLVGPGELERANGYQQVSLLLLANLIGPPVGAALFVLNQGLPILIDAISYAVAAVLIWSMRKAAPAPERSAERHLGRELAEGLRFLWRHTLLRSLCLLLVVVNAVNAGIVAILVLYVLDELELPPAGFGWMVAIYATGGVAGAFLAPRLSRSMSVFASLLTAMIIGSVSIICFGLVPELAMVIVAGIVLGFGSAWWSVVTITMRQRIVPKELLGRVTSVYRMVAFAAAPLGAVGAGFLAHQTGLRTPYVVMGLLQLASTAVFAPVIRSQLKILTPEVSRVA